MELHANSGPAVGYVVSVWPRLSETFILNEVIGVERLGARLRIFSIKDPKDELVHAKVREVRARVTYISIRRNRKAVWKSSFRLLASHPVRYCRTLVRAIGYGRRIVLRRFFQASYLADLLQQEPLINHLHAHFANDPTLVTMFVHQLIGIPYTFTAHAKDIYVKTPPAILRAEAERARAIVTCTDYNRRYLQTQIGPVSDKKLHCIYHGLDLAQFNFPRTRRSESPSPVILCVARLVEKKGISDLVLAADILRHRGRCFQVEIVGNGPLRPSLEAQVKDLGLSEHVKLVGALPHETLCRAYQRVSVFALPCIVAADGDRDGIPNVLLEAMASGVPVVSTPVSGIPELIDSEREGILVPPNSAPDLADALDRLLASAELRERLASAGRAKVEAYFSIERNSAQLLALFQVGVAG